MNQNERYLDKQKKTEREKELVREEERERHRERYSEKERDRVNIIVSGKSEGEASRTGKEG